MQDFLHNIFSRGSYARTDAPVIVVGGVDNQSATLTYDVAHFSGGAVLVHTVNAAAASGTSTISGNVNVVQWGSSNVQSASFGVPTVGWFQRLDRTNDAATVWNATTIAATQTNITGTVGSVSVESTNSGRYMVMAVNDSTAVMYLQYGVTAASNASAVRIPSLGYWEMPAPIWQGSLATIWDSTNAGAGRFTILS